MSDQVKVKNAILSCLTCALFRHIAIVAPHSDHVAACFVSSCLSHGAARLLSFTVSSCLASFRLAKCSYLLGLPRAALRRVICSWKWRARKVEYDSRILGTAGPSCLPLVRVLLESRGRLPVVAAVPANTP